MPYDVGVPIVLICYRFTFFKNARGSVLDVAVAKVSLQRSGIVSLIRERVAASVPQHVRVRLEPKFGFGARTLDHASEASRREWRAPF